MKINLFAIILLSFCFLTACSLDGKRNIKEYYFPVKELKDPKVYEYRALGTADTLPNDYWYYRTLVQDGNIYFTGNYYDGDFVVQQFVREEMVRNGMLLNEIFLYAFDPEGKQVQVPVEVLADSAFPFEVSDPSGIFLYKIKWITQYEPLATTTLIKNRRYIGDTTYNYKGKELDCVYFEVRELVESFEEGNGYMEPEYAGIEIYAKDVGLIYYRKDIAKNTSLAYELADIYKMEDLEEKFKNRLKN